MSRKGKSSQLSRRDAQGLAGIIKKVELTNFMCHSHLVLELNPRVNMVVGKNGSGKSAIMAALMVVLGTKASDTARGRSLAAFVKLGCRQAVVKITLSNQGPNSYKMDRYGLLIVLTRTIAAKGANRLTVGLASGNVVTCSKSELGEVLQALNINLPNPFALLTQETMKTFLHNNKPSQMFTLIEQGTGVSAIKVRLAELKDKVSGLVKKKSQMAASLKRVEEELKTWKQKVKQHEKTHQASSKLERLQLELAWAGVREEEEKELQLSGRLDALCSEQNSFQTKIDKLADERSKVQDQLKLEIEDWRNARNLYTQKKQDKDLKYKMHLDAQNRIDELRRSMQSLDGQISVLNRERKDLQAEIARIANQSSDAETRKRAREQEQLEQNKSNLAAALQELTPLVEQLDVERRQMRDLQHWAANAKEHMESTRSGLRNAEQNFARVRRESSASAIPPVFGPKMPDLLREVDRAAQQGSFKHKPVGPIGLHLKLKDYSWSLAVENLLRSEMQVFFCDNFDDKNVLDGLARRIVGRPVQCVVSKFFDHPFDIQNTKAVAPPGLLSLLDILDIEDPRLFNFFLDQRRVENVLLCADTRKAIEMMQSSETVPSNCSLIVTKDAEQVFPSPNFKVYGKEGDVQILVKSTEANIALYEQRVAQAAEERKSAEEEWRQREDDYKKHKEQVAAHETRRKELDQTVERLTAAIRVAENQQPVNSVDNLQTLQEELEENEMKIAEIQSQREHASEARSEQEAIKKQYEVELKQLAAEFRVLDEKCSQCEMRKRQLERKLEDEEDNAQRRKQRQKVMAEKRVQLEAELTTQRKKVADAAAAANVVGERVNTQKDRSSILREIERQNSVIKKLNAELEDVDVVKAEVERLDEKVAKDTENLQLVAKNLAEMEDSMKKRVSFYGNAVMNTFVHINLYFSNLFGSQPIEGKLEVNLEKQTMSISTNFKGRSGEGARNLSGGERSFTTVALVLAVWNKLLVPFYMLDEFDVFMDMANRRKATDMLLREADSRPTNQFIFFTPQELNLAAQPHITIHKLSDPRAS
ncbi:structural maintenance of chromosomes protein 6 [Cloeon dipterum]|uniref:structural maintenance of chromosomes protein 6 n=1 Tax=Cloeon dipterum TaxID=197152 RepID=UPI00321FCC10